MLVITETWFDKASIYNDLVPDGYSIHLQNRIDRRGGGVAIVYRTSLHVTRETPTQLSSFEHTSIIISNIKPTIRVIGLYRPPNLKKSADFSDDLALLLENYNSTPHRTVISGDFNAHMNNNSDVFAKAICSVLSDCNLKQHIAEPTHRLGNILDLVITPADGELIVKITVHDYSISDHYLVVAKLSCCVEPPKMQQRTYRAFKAIVADTFCKDLSQTDMFLSPSDDVNVFVAQIESNITGVLNVHAPLKTTKRHRQAEHWQDKLIDELKQRRRYFERKYRRTRSGAYKRMYKLMCRCTNSVITTRHKKHFAEKIDVSSGSKMAWKQAQKLLSTTDEPTENSPTDIVKLCDSLQAFFSDKINKISLNISSLIASLQLPNLPHSTSCPKLQNSLTTFHQVTEDDVKRIITSSPPKTSGADVMPTWLLLQCLETLAPSFTRLFNLSLSSGVFPESFKSARVTPLIKKPGLDKTVYSNYRPISNLAFLGKTLERIVLEQLQCHMDSEPVLNPNQSAYRRLHSTETALNRITNDILSAMDNRKVTIMSCSTSQQLSTRSIIRFCSKG